MRLSDYLDGFATKKLTRVDLPKAGGIQAGSNQHEINGVASLRRLLGSRRIEGTILWSYVLDDQVEILAETGDFTFYDARERHATRTEWRFYYTSNAVMSAAQDGDFLVLLRIKGTPSTTLVAFIFRSGTSWEKKSTLLFGAFPEKELETQTEQDLWSHEVELAEAALLEMLGLGRGVSESDIVRMVDRDFPGDQFPSTKKLAAYARESLGTLGTKSPDELLNAWLKRETELFYAIEQRIVGARLRKPEAFQTVTEFLEYSLSVQNRRKARMGFSLENQLAALFTEVGLKFDHPGRTEGRSRPDFLFPSSRSYQDAAFEVSRLRMVGAKATCKDRWRQILAEADRIKTKHLCTLEPSISQNQTDEMTRHRVVLVVPVHLHHSFTSSQRSRIMSLADFIEETRGLHKSVSTVD